MAAYDYFISRRGSVGDVAREVAEVLIEEGYSVLLQDYDIPLGTSFVEAMHEGIKTSRDLIVLLTRDYETSGYTRKEFTSFEAQRLRNPSEHHIVILRCEDVPPDGLLADNVFQDLMGVSDPAERRKRILAAARREALSERKSVRPFIDVPPPLVNFVGRPEDLDRLDDILRYDARQSSLPGAARRTGRAAVVGAGGLGKTSLAIEYARRYRPFYAGIIWCPAETRTGLVATLAMLAGWLGGRAPTASEELDAAARDTMRRLSEKPGTWLLVYDNVASPDVVEQFIPPDGVRLLVTSRSATWSGWAEQLVLQGLAREEAVDLVSARSGRSGDATEVERLAEALGYLPLALDHAAAFCRMSGASFSDYRSRIAEMIRLVPAGAPYRESVHAAVGLGYDAVAEKPRNLLHRLAFLAPDHIGTDMLAVAEPDLAQRVVILESLASLSLVLLDDTKVQMHRLTQEIVRQNFRERHDFGEIRSDLRMMVEAAFIARKPRLFDPIWELLFFCAHHDPDPNASVNVNYEFNEHLDMSIKCQKQGERMWVTSQVFAHHGQDHYSVTEYRLTDRWERVAA